MKSWNLILSPHSLQLDRALGIYTAALPRHARLIQLAGEVLRQLAAVQAVLPPPPAMADQEIEAKLAAGQPVSRHVPIPATIFQDTFGRLLELFRHFELLPSLAAGQLHNLLALSPQTWLEEPSLAGVCQTFDLPAGLLSFLGQKALSPFYHQAAAPVRQKLFQADWSKGQCPFCGRPPALASLVSDSGQRVLYCSLCGVQWPFSRQTCAFCGRQESQISYVFLEDDPARRADLCQTCRRYLKTIVTHRLPHALYLPLEEFVSIDLDALLLRQGLIS